MPKGYFGWGKYQPALDYYMYNGGTSMATPLVAGCAALVRQYLREYEGVENPSAALVKAILIHAAEYINYPYAHKSSGPWADNEQGWGRINLKNCLFPSETSRRICFIDQVNGLSQGEMPHRIKLNDNASPLRITLVYTDAPGERLINNLNLYAYAPNGVDYYVGNDFKGTKKPDTVNNVEGIIVPSPATGNWLLKVDAKEVNVGAQDYALVISGGGLEMLK
jgi:hypothetical protein